MFKMLKVAGSENHIPCMDVETGPSWHDFLLFSLVGSKATIFQRGRKQFRKHICLAYISQRVQVPNIRGFWLQIHKRYGVWNQKPRILGTWTL